ncbi:MAG: TRAP transporter small permease [Pseudomonadota bacterium]|nr:TRAP transporter small permease [Pseudomonadota bacterium]
MTFTGRVLGWLVMASTAIGAAAVMLMMLQIVADVLLKNLFEFPLPATTIFVAHYYMVVVAYLPVALAEKLNSHITVEILAQHFARRYRVWLTAVMWLASAVVAGAIAHRLWLEAMKKYDFGTFMIEQDVTFMIWPGYFVLPLGFGLFALVLLYRFACAVTGAASGLGEVVDDVDGQRVHQQAE